MKDAYYFSHDTNAREDPKVLQMCSVYGAEGYGWYWMLIEMMADQSNYRLDMRSQYARNAVAMRIYAKPEIFEKYLSDCVYEFQSDGKGLFQTDKKTPGYYWTDSLIRRMEKKEKTSEKARNAAFARWGKDSVNDQKISNAQAMQPQCPSNAKERKGKERKEREGTPSFSAQKKKKISEFSNNEKVKTSIIAFLEMREAKGKDTSGHALDELLVKAKALSKSDRELAALFDQSTVNCWADLFALKEELPDDPTEKVDRPEPEHRPLWELPGWEGMTPADSEAEWKGEEEIARKFKDGNGKA